MTHIAVQEALNGSPVSWTEHVSDEQYGGDGVSSMATDRLNQVSLAYPACRSTPLYSEQRPIRHQGRRIHTLTP
jgi:hypothetical protein